MREPESHVTPEYELWSCEHPDASEDEVVELLGSLVRAEKPKVSVEVGAHIGVATEAIGRALERNGRGHLHSFELDPTRAAEAAARCAGLPVTIHEQKDTAARRTRSARSTSCSSTATSSTARPRSTTGCRCCARTP